MRRRATPLPAQSPVKLPSDRLQSAAAAGPARCPKEFGRLSSLVEMKETLSGVRALLTQRDRWTRVWEATDRFGVSVDFAHSEAVAWSIVGAVRSEAELCGTDPTPVLRYLVDRAQALGFENLVDLNLAFSHHEVLVFLNKSILDLKVQAVIEDTKRIMPSAKCLLSYACRTAPGA